MAPFGSQNKVDKVVWKASSYTPLSTSDSETGTALGPEIRSSISKAQRLLPWILHILLILTYTAIYILSFQRNTNNDSLGIPYVQKVFEVNPHLNKSTARIYTGAPSDELEAAWHKLMRYANIRVPESEIRRLDRMENSVRFTDGSGYFGQMTVFHHLHCIKRIHKFLNVEHYWPNATAEELFLLRAHNFHCLDTLRQAIMCHGDTSLITFKWGTKQPVPSANWSTPHTCRSWEALEEWNKERFVDVFQPGLVVHPKFGPAYGTLSDREGTGTVIE
ncbi:hypothetical protein BKA64DRAFT_757038 [Cadophora sp. MPI-SDFR-AT-0126]|nr:hypothetical protein BKA64DRAFT_757038 [Leotiomycetes sp. MPI-SDFR-AT-0126]